MSLTMIQKLLQKQKAMVLQFASILNKTDEELKQLIIVNIDFYFFIFIVVRIILINSLLHKVKKINIFNFGKVNTL